MLSSHRYRSRQGLSVRKSASRTPRLPRTWVEALESRQLLNASPVIDPIADVQSPPGKPLILPIVSNDADGDRLVYSFVSSNTKIKVQLHKKNPYLRLTIQNYGTMTFQLLRDLAPKTVDIISGLAQGEYYDGLTFHRIANLAAPSAPSAWIIQGGDAAGTGSGTPPFQFDDEFNLGAMFTGKGQLAMAKAGDDTNGTQFFITNGSPRHLGFNHTIFGQLVRGTAILNQLINLPTDSSGKPTTPPVITKAELIQDYTDAVVTVTAPAGATGNVTVNVSDGHGGTATDTFRVTGVADSVDEMPYLAPMADIFSPIGTPAIIPLKAIHADSDVYGFWGQWVDSTSSHADPALSGFVDTKTVRIAPKKGYVGPIRFKVRVYKKADLDKINQGLISADDQSLAYDQQVITIAFGDKPVTAARATRIKAIAGKSGTFYVAAFKDTDLKGKPSDFTASINWGDSQVSAGTVVAGERGLFYVKGTNAYRSEGRYTTITTITGKSGARQVLYNYATVYDASLTVKPSVVIGYPNASLTDMVLATFTDGDPRSKVTDFTATINWGDGTTTSSATLSKAGTTYSIKGTHVYITAGSFPILIKIYDVGGGRTNATVNALIGRSTLTVNGGPDITTTDVNPLNEGSVLNRVATITDTEDGHTYTASVDWGDGSARENVPVVDKSITLSHQYKDSDTYKLLIIVTDEVGGTGNDTVSIGVKNVAPTVVVSGDTTGVRGLSRKITFTTSDPSPVDLSGIYYWIEWGDGAQDYAPSGSTSASHVYTTNSAQPYTVKVKAYDKSGTEGSGTLAMSIVPAMVMTDPYDADKTMLAVGGTKTDDVITIKAAPDDKLDVLFGDTSVGVFAPTGRIVVFGGDGNDKITIEQLIDHPAELYGEKDNDTLIGSAGSDILVGGTQDDSLYGGGARDILIGGAGKDVLDGRGNEDIIIAGATAYDSNSYALGRLRMEWTRTDQNYTQRLAHLSKTAGGYNGKYAFRSRTLTDDTDIDTLYGGTSADLLYAHTTAGSTKDVLKDKAKTETVIPI